ncbi:MAG: ATPase, T2SS/T4P/T4SS family [Candidatus Omnitrophota bacterium]
MAKRSDTILYEALLEKGLITKEALEPLLKEVLSTGKSLQQIVVNKGIAREQDVLDLLAEKMKLSCINLKAIPVDKEIINKIPVKIALYYKFMPVELKERNLTIAVASPLDLKTQDEIRTQLGYDIIMVLSCHDDITECLKKYYGIAADTIEMIAATGSKARPSSEAPQEQAVEDIGKMAEDASVIKLVNQIILEAWKKRATDIHIEPYRQSVALRYRIDGILYDANVGPEVKNFLNAIISRIKIMSSLNIVERRLPQDGRAVVRVQEQVLDLRISTIPTPYGESIVVRILPTQMLFSLEKLGLPKRDMQTFEELIQKPHGIIFVTGPTGSGKTTTLYTCLSRINTKDRKIITIEDPIEYEMPGITQIQVMPEIGLDFARGLRSILRHDPDVIMVGEVRDIETAEIAIRVALTGHLVFSTLHTNDAASGITRLIDIGVEPYLLASSVEAFIAQRLIRVLCPECKYEDKAAPPELKKIIAADLGLRSIDEVKVFKAKGCNSCNFTGFFGRTAIYEILLIDERIRGLILKKTTSEEIKKAAIIRGMRTLRQDGWQKVISGISTPEEVMKVTSAEDKLDKGGKNEAYANSAPLPEHSEEAFRPDDKRVYSRLNNKVNLRYSVIKSEEELVKKGYAAEQFSVTKNISAGGLVFVTNDPLPVGSIIELKIELPNRQEPVQCLSRVVRIEETGGKYNIAVCFLDVTGSQRSLLDKYVEEEKG